jgi:hypothetical protein
LRHQPLNLCSVASAQADLKYWDRADTSPMVSRVDGEGVEPRYDIELVEAVLPSEPPLSPERLGDEQLRQLYNRDHAVCGVMELDYFLKRRDDRKEERTQSIRVALAVDADSGIGLRQSLKVAALHPDLPAKRGWFQSLS